MNYTKHAKLTAIMVVGFVGIAFAASRQSPFVTKIARNDGDTRTPIYVSVSSTTWTQIVEQDYRNRRVLLQTLASADTVCLSSVTTASIICDATTKGARLVATKDYEDYSEAVLYGRAADTKSAVAVYGMKYHDSKDSSSFE